MRWYADPVLLALIVLCVFSGACALLEGIRSKQSGPKVSPPHFLVARADGVLHTMMRSPVVDPPPCPDTAPGGVSFPPPGTTSPEEARQFGLRTLRGPRP